MNMNGLTMAKPNILNPRPTDFDSFLYAPVGDDPHENSMTVITTLARINLDPWKATAELVARSRLEMLLTRFSDVPTLESDHGRVARDLGQLLPESLAPVSLKQAVSTVAIGRLGTTGVSWATFAITFMLFQMLMAGGSGSGQ